MTHHLTPHSTDLWSINTSSPSCPAAVALDDLSCAMESGFNEGNVDTCRRTKPKIPDPSRLVTSVNVQARLPRRISKQNYS